MRTILTCIFILFFSQIAAVGASFTTGNGSSTAPVKIYRGNGSLSEEVSLYRGNGSTAQLICGPSGGVACSGDILSGDNESFEAAAGEFCTTGWTLTNPDSKVDTYSSEAYHCGTHSIKITANSSTASSNYAYVNLGSNDTDYMVRGYVKLPTLASLGFTQFLGAAGSTACTNVSYLQWYNNSGTYELKLRTLAENPAEKFLLTPGQTYRFEVNFKRNATSTLKIFDSSESPVLTTNGGSDYIQEAAGPDNLQQYVCIVDNYSAASDVNIYLDDVSVNLSGTSDIGEQTCN